MDKFDFYLGGGFGYRNVKWKFSTDEPNSTGKEAVPLVFPFGFEVTMGGRYYFNNNIGAYLEWGAAKSILQTGLFIKFGDVNNKQ